MSEKVDYGARELWDKETVASTSTPPPEETKPILPPPNYVIQIPKDQIYRIPPPENAHKYKLYTRRAERRRRSRPCCRFLLWFIAAILFLAVAVGITAGVLYLVFRPKLPSYSIESIAVSGLNLSTLGNIFSPEIDVAVRAENPNHKIGIYYKDKSSIRAFYSDLELCSGKWPTFYHGRRNTTVVHVALLGSRIELSKAVREELAAEEKRGAVRLRILLHVPVRFKFGAATTWTLTVKTRCEVTVDKLGKKAKIKDGSKCKVYEVKPFS